MSRSFRGGGRRGRGGFGGRGGGGFGGRGRGGRGGFRNFDAGPPDQIREIGYFTHPCQDDLVCKATIDEVPYFNTPVYLENKQQIGKIDEIYGPIRDYCVTVKLSEDVKASSFAPNQKIYIDPMKVIALAKFLPKPPGEKEAGRGRGGRGGGGRGRGGSGFGGRGGRGGGRGGFGGGRGGGFNRGGFNRDSGGGRGGFNRDSGGGRGGFNRDSGGGRGGFNRDSGGGGFKRSFDGDNNFSQNKRQKFD